MKWVPYDRNCQNQEGTNIMIQIALYHIQCSLQSIVQNDKIKWPVKEPHLERLPPCITQQKPLQPIMKDESSNENNILILEDIYRRQLGIEENSNTFLNLLRATSGDQKTWARMWSAYCIRADTSEKPANSLSWNLPILGLWHYRYNLIGLLHDTYWGSPLPKKPTKRDAEKQSSVPPVDGVQVPEQADFQDASDGTDVRAQLDASSLQFAADRWGRTNVVDLKNFVAVEEVGISVSVIILKNLTGYSFNCSVQA